MKKAELLEQQSYAFSGSDNTANQRVESLKQKLMRFRKPLDNNIRDTEYFPTLDKLNDPETLKKELLKVRDKNGNCFNHALS